MVIGLFIDLWNWWYTRNRVKLLKTSKEIWQSNRLKVSVLGVLYTVIEVDKSIPEGLVERYLMKRLNMVDDALVSINLDGLMHFSHKLYGETETTRYYIVKFIPNMPHWTWRYFIASMVVVFLIIYLGNRFGLWSWIANLIMPYLKPLLDAIY